MARLGLIVNPVAGLGGRAGLKGSDGNDVQRRALALGARPEAGKRAVRALKTLLPLRERLEIISYPGEMGEDAARQAGFEPRVLGRIEPGRTTPEDTRRAARQMRDAGIALLLFAGGDGTARNVYEAIGETLPVIGVPAGVKIHSAVYAVSPEAAGWLARDFLEGRIQELILA
ncbi:MAG TPA: ATP-NAD kinase, partial [Anaerolineae bacterium]|nr:ATP-NAD kinase [Anaerolineae bacterium]